MTRRMKAVAATGFIIGAIGSFHSLTTSLAMLLAFVVAIIVMGGRT